MIHCADCKVKFCKYSNLRTHVKRKHPEKINILAPKIKGQYGTYICQECKNTFVNIGNLRAHVRHKHPEKINILAPKIKGQYRIGTYICQECKSTFVNIRNLRVHDQHKHPEKIAELVPIKNKIFHCQQCNIDFGSLKQLTLHQKTHKKTHRLRSKAKMLKCPLCQHTGESSKHLISHYRIEHSLAVDSDTLEFETFDAFQVWKMNTEKETFSSFINMHGVVQGRNCKRIQFACHRSGDVRKMDNPIRSFKKQGSNKINGYCPAEMKVTIEETKCVVHFCKTHVGHRLEQDMRHLVLSAADRQDIASKIAAKIPIQTILDEVRDSGSNGHLERFHLLTKKDLHNIKRKFNLNESAVRNSYDAISLDAWVDELKTDGSILFYKPQESTSNEYPQLKQEDFLLIIMTEEQKELLLRFGNDCICVDGTHDLNGYGFELHTILVLDDLKEGYPSAFFISNRNDAEVLKIFFLCVQGKIEKKIKPLLFMSDMAEAYYNAWVKVMHPAEFRLYCTWHIDRAWRKNLEKVSNNENKVLIYRKLRMLLCEKDIATFNNSMQKFLEFCRESPGCLEFANYFEQHYKNKVEHWAYCFRLYSGLNTNMHIERMHRTIKHLYLNGKYVKRLDKTIGAILKFVRDKICDRLNVAYKSKVRTKLANLKQRHKTSEMESVNRVAQRDVGWIVAATSTKEIYIVEELQSECTCKLICDVCGVCIHRYTCTCLDCSIKWNMCKHIHLVCRFINLNQTSISKEAGEVLADTRLANDMNQVIKVEETTNLIMAVSTNESKSQNLSEEKQKLGQTLLQHIAGAQTFEEIEAIKKICAPIQATLEAIRMNQIHDSFLPSTSVSSIRSIPHNEKVGTQRRLFKTNKQT